MHITSKFAPKPATVAVSIALASLSVCSASAELTAEQVLSRCKRAYNSCKTYSGTTRVMTKGDIGGMKQSYNTSANIQFTRPRKIRVEGTLMSTGTFIFVSDGNNTCESSTLSGGTWKKPRAQRWLLHTLRGFHRGLPPPFLQFCLILSGVTLFPQAARVN